MSQLIDGIEPEVLERALRGYFLMGLMKPAWRDEVTVPLDMGSDYWCVLGQAYGAYPEGVEALRLADGHRLSTRFGFDRDRDTWSWDRDWHLQLAQNTTQYNRLTRAWGFILAD